MEREMFRTYATSLLKVLLQVNDVVEDVMKINMMAKLNTI